MSVLIKGMEMPQKCGQCKLFHAEHPMYCMVVEGHRTVGAPYGMPRPDWCPLVDVKEPHGRLIDIKFVEDGKFVNADNEYQKWWNGALESVINYAQRQSSMQKGANEE